VAPAWRVCHDLSRDAVAVTTPAHHSPNSDMVLTPVAPVTLATLADLLQRYRFLTEQRPGARYRFFLRVHYVKGEVNQGADGRSRGTIGPSSLPQDGWDWRSLPVPAPIRHLGTNESSALLPPQSPGRTLCPPQQPDIWADTLANELARASPPTWVHCVASAPLIPFVPYHPAWQPAMRDATGLPAW